MPWSQISGSRFILSIKPCQVEEANASMVGRKPIRLDKASQPRARTLSLKEKFIQSQSIQHAKNGAVRVKMIGKSKAQLEGNPAELLGLLNQLKDGDSKAEANKRWGCLAGAVGLLFFVGGVSIKGMAATVLLPLGALVLVAGILAWWYFDRFDLDDSIQDTAKELVTYLQEDLGEKGKARLDLNFGSTTAKSCFLRKDKPKKSGGFLTSKTTRTTHYKHPTLSLKTRLQDGTSISLTLYRRVKHQKITKRKMTKTKYRTRSYTRSIVALRAQVPKERYGALNGLAGVLKAAPLEEFSVGRLNVEGQTIKATLNAPWGSGRVESHSCLKVLVWLYYGLKKMKASRISA